MAKGKYEYWLSSDGLTLLAAWARDGLTDEQIAHNCGVSCATLYRWKAKHCEICETLKKSKEIVDVEVENALIRRALGYDAVEVRTEKTNEGFERTITTTRHIPPDVAAIAIWLKNRRPDRWRDKPDTAVVSLPDIEQDPLSAALED